jgi:hypothetical protein
MSMADQYDDGRYDSRDEFGHVVLPGGWHVPASQMTGWPFGPRRLDPGPGHPLGLPIHAPRGGIKYQQKGKTPVAKTLEQQLTDLKRQHKATHENLGYLAERIAELDKKVKARRTPPDSKQFAWSIDVRFTPDGKLYQYLILRAGEVFYTTGTGLDGKFYTWGTLLEWLDGMASHSAMIPMRTDYEMKAPLEGRRGE